MAVQEPGGFFQSALLSPPPSTHASSAATALPHARNSPLKVGGKKESALIRYVDQGILHVQRRFAKREADGEVGDAAVQGNVRAEIAEMGKSDSVIGYRSFGEAAVDIERLVDVIWISGTPSVQIPYLLNVALLVSNFLPELPPSPRAMFGLLSKLDIAFASLLQGRNVETGEQLAGVGGRGVSGTEKVRIKSIVDRTRICVVEALRKGEGEIDEEDDVDAMEIESEDDADDFNMGPTTDEEVEEKHSGGLLARERHGDWDVHMAKVYDCTLVELGDALGGTPIGIVSDG